MLKTFIESRRFEGAFTVLNLFIGVIVSAMEAEHDAEESAERQDDQQELLREIRALRDEVRELKSGIRPV